MQVLTTQEQLRAHNHKPPGYGFLCHECKEAKPFPSEGGGTGYGYDSDHNPICYECCGKRDRAHMLKEGRITLYLTTDRHGDCRVSNWPNTLSFKGGYKVGRHNFSGKRYDVWFHGPEGTKWHGVTYGDNTQLCHCKRLKKGF